MSTDLLLDDIVKKPREECKGLVFRANVNNHIDGKGNYVEQTRMYLLKNKSCKGCPKCLNTLDTLRELVTDQERPIMPSTIGGGKLYGLRYVNVQRDWESGFVDSFDMEYFELNIN